MKKFILVLLIILGIATVGMNLPQKNSKVEYLRLHIRANSNLEVDQNVKYKVKDCVVEYLTPYFSSISNKEEAITLVKDMSEGIENKCKQVLDENGFSYSVKVKINNEFFPTRKYDNVTLESGYYDAVIIELGEAKGDNWWCVMYPPLCFVNKNENGTQIKFESRIKRWLKSVFD